MTEQSESTPPSSDVTSDDQLWGLLSYIISPIVPIIILLMEDKKDRPFLKYHAFQALILGLVGGIISFVLSFVFVGICTGIATVGLLIYYGIKAYQGEYVVIPLVTDFIKNQGWV